MSARERLHRVVELLPEDEVEAALRFVESLHDTQRGDEFTRVLMEAPEDDEPLSPDEISRLDRAAEEARKGLTIPWEEVRRQIG